MRNFEHENATTIEGAIDLLQAESSKAIAGGTDLLHEMKEGLIAPSRLVNLKSAEGTSYISFDGSGGMRLGAVTKLAELENHGGLRESFPAIAAAVDTIASPQIRNMATVAGNLCQRPRCWYYRDEALHCTRKGGPFCYAQAGENTYHAILGGGECIIVHPSDLAPALMAYDATITIAGPRGETTAPLGDFFIGPDVDVTRENILVPGQVVREISVPAPGAGSNGVYLKVRDRGSWDFATVSVAAVLEMDGGVCRQARIVLGGVAPVPWAVPAVERMLVGARIDEDLAARAGETAIAGGDPLELNGYKVPMARNLVKRAILEAAG